MGVNERKSTILKHTNDALSGVRHQFDPKGHGPKEGAMYFRTRNTNLNYVNDKFNGIMFIFAHYTFSIAIFYHVHYRASVM